MYVVVGDIDLYNYSIHSTENKNHWTRERGILITRWMIEDALSWDEASVSKYLCRDTFVKHSLCEMLDDVYHGDVFACLNDAYPEMFQWWQLASVYDQDWDFDTAVAAVRWLIQERLNLSVSEIKSVYSNRFLIEHGLKNVTFKYSLFEILEAIYPGVIKPWELESYCMRNFWNKERAKEAVKWLVEEVLAITPEEARFIRKKTFQKHRIGGAYKYFHMTCSEIIDYVYFNRCPLEERQYVVDTLSEDELKALYLDIVHYRKNRFPKNFFNPDRVPAYGILTKTLVEVVLGWTYQEALQKLNVEHFRLNVLGGMLREIYSNNVSLALSDAYPME